VIRIISFAVFAATILSSSVPAFAAKEKFERTKPHVNVGTSASKATGELAVATVRLAVPTENQGGGPECSFEGTAIVSSLTGYSGSSSVETTDTLEEISTHDVDLSSSRQVMVIPLNIPPTGALRQHFLFEVLSGDTKSKDRCGLDVSVDVFDSSTGESRARHKPFFTNYRPQFYLRTTDVTGDSTSP